MNWIEPQFKDICNTDIVYYSEKYKETCRKINELLYINNFPSFNDNKFWEYKNKNWVETKINRNFQKKTIDYVFDDVYWDIEETDRIDDKILYVYDDDNLFGVLHYTEYYSEIVFNQLYKNFYSFETSLRNYIIYNNYGYEDFLIFFDEKSKSSKNNKEYWINRRDYLQKELKKGAENKFPNLQVLLFLDIIRFCNHKKEKLKIDFNKEYINELRNIIMHSKTSDNFIEKFDWNSFKKFLFLVQDFKKIFIELKQLLNQIKKEDRIKYNDIILSGIKDLEDNEIKRYFHRR